MADLDEKVEDKESKGFMRKALDLGYNVALAGATTALGVATFGIGAPMIGGALAAGIMAGNLINGDKSLYDMTIDSLRSYSVINTLITPVSTLGEFGYEVMAGLGYTDHLSKFAFAMTGFHGIFSVFYRGINHMFENYFNPKGITKSLTENYFYGHALAATAFSPGWYLTSGGLGAVSMLGTMVPTFALNAPLVGLAEKLFPPTDKKVSPQSQYNPAPA